LLLMMMIDERRWRLCKRGAVSDQMPPAAHGMPWSEALTTLDGRQDMARMPASDWRSYGASLQSRSGCFKNAADSNSGH
jgi:hypothetical protein